MQKMMTPATTDPQQASMQSVMKFMPFMFGYFALVVPSGLTLYWFTSNILAMAQQYFTKTQTGTSSAPAKEQPVKSPASADLAPVSASADSAPATNPGGSTKSKDARRKRKKRRKKR
jgi:YidC/Oxa1 family membrane protein insertase